MRKSYSFQEENFKSSIKRSHTTSTANPSIYSERGFKPTDRFDAQKNSFLVGLSQKIWTKRVDKLLNNVQWI